MTFRKTGAAAWALAALLVVAVTATSIPAGAQEFQQAPSPNLRAT
jgi:hypothetical protein